MSWNSKNNTIENKIYIKVEQSLRDQQQVVLAQDTLLNPFVAPRGAGEIVTVKQVCVRACHFLKVCSKMWHLVISHNCN